MHSFGQTLLAQVLHSDCAFGGAPLRTRVPSYRSASPVSRDDERSDYSSRAAPASTPAAFSLSYLPMPGAYGKSITEMTAPDLDVRSVVSISTTGSSDSEKTLTDCERMVIDYHHRKD